MSESYLAHHGTPNMKWGIRNGPPYPLSAVQKSVGKIKTKMNKGEITKSEAIKQEKEVIKNNPETAHKVTQPIEKQNKTEIKKLAKAQDVYKNRTEMSSKELKAYLDRVDLEKRVGELAKKEYEQEHPIKTLAGKFIDSAKNELVNKAKNKFVKEVSDAVEAVLKELD